MFFKRRNTQKLINATFLLMLAELETQVSELEDTVEEIREDLDFVLDAIEDEYGN